MFSSCVSTLWEEIKIITQQYAIRTQVGVDCSIVCRAELWVKFLSWERSSLNFVESLISFIFVDSTSFNMHWKPGSFCFRKFMMNTPSYLLLPQAQSTKPNQKKPNQKKPNQTKPNHLFLWRVQYCFQCQDELPFIVVNICITSVRRWKIHFGPWFWRFQSMVVWHFAFGAGSNTVYHG